MIKQKPLGMCLIALVRTLVWQRNTLWETKSLTTLNKEFDGKRKRKDGEFINQEDVATATASMEHNNIKKAE